MESCGKTLETDPGVFFKNERGELFVYVTQPAIHNPGCFSTSKMPPIVREALCEIILHFAAQENSVERQLMAVQTFLVLAQLWMEENSVCLSEIRVGLVCLPKIRKELVCLSEPRVKVDGRSWES